MTILEDRTDLIELASGNFLSVGDPDPQDISLGDVAHGLSLTCRFSGQCSQFYCVAEHALLVSRRLHDLGLGYETQLAGLHHDDAEAFVTDVPRPAKQLMPGYVEIEERVLRAVLVSIGIDHLSVHSADVKRADDWALAQEAGELMPSTGRYWRLGHEWDGEERSLGGEASEQVRLRWLRRHRYLTGKLQDGTT